jgi:hypothetical protein
VNYIFHGTKIPIVDKKVHVWTKFRRKKIRKKVKSPLSMNFERISTSKCRGKLQKMGYCTPNPPQEAQALATCKGLKKIIKKRIQKNFKKIPQPVV